MRKSSSLVAEADDEKRNEVQSRSECEEKSVCPY